MLSTLAARAQATPASEPAPLPPPTGEVLFESHGTPPSTPVDTSTRTLTTLDGTPAITDAARSAILFTAYDLDGRLTPATAGLVMRARLTLRNTSEDPLPRVTLQISSSLHWESITLNGIPLTLTQHFVDTDTDHTGKVSEAVLNLPQPLAPGASLTLDTLYSGSIPQDATRLERIGATPAQALDADWDAIANPGLSTSSSDPTTSPSPLTTALRGFGNVIWYPVSTAPLFLGDGARLFQAVAAMRLTESSATIRLHLAVEYQGEAPTAAYFCGRRQKLTALPDDPSQPIASGSGMATADFAPESLGFRLPSLFLIDHPEALVAPLTEPESIADPPATTSLSSSLPTTNLSSRPESSPSHRDDAAARPAAPVPDPGNSPLLAVESTDDSRLSQLAITTQTIAPLLQKWLGPQPLTALTILDHPGEPFEDGPLLVAPIASLAAASSIPALVHSLTHAWVQTGQPWIDEGLAQFMGLLWTEQQQGRSAALAQLTDLLQPVAIAEPAFAADSAPIGQPLIAAASDLFYRRKAAAVWWMLRGITGDQPLATALAAFRAQPSSHENGLAQAHAFELSLEQSSKLDLAWFFNDWIFQDRGLPDLTITSVEPRQLPAGKGHDSGWLVAVTVRNDGPAIAEVPVIIRSGTFSTTKRLRIPGSSSATDRVLLEAAPTEVQVNDGSIPELRTSTHIRSVTLKSDNISEPLTTNH